MNNPKHRQPISAPDVLALDLLAERINHHTRGAHRRGLHAGEPDPNETLGSSAYCPGRHCLGRAYAARHRFGVVGMSHTEGE